MDSIGQLLSSQLSDGAQQVLLVIGALAAMLGLMILWGYICAAVYDSDAQYRRLEQERDREELNAVNNALRSQDRASGLRDSGW